MHSVSYQIAWIFCTLCAYVCWVLQLWLLGNTVGDCSWILFLDIECQATFAACYSDISDRGDTKTGDMHDETLAADDINVDFPSLKAARSFHEKKHDSCSASEARKFKLARLRTSDPVDSQHSLAEYQSYTAAACHTPETPESIPACNTFAESRHSAVPVWSGDVVWKALRRKSSSSDSDVAVPQRRKVLSDKEQKRPIIGVSSSHTGKQLTSMSLVLGDFLKPSQEPVSADEQSSEYVPMFVCTLCGDRTHSCRECTRRLAERFCD